MPVQPLEPQLDAATASVDEPCCSTFLKNTIWFFFFCYYTVSTMRTKDCAAVPVPIVTVAEKSTSGQPAKRRISTGNAAFRVVVVVQYENFLSHLSVPTSGLGVAEGPLLRAPLPPPWCPVALLKCAGRPSRAQPSRRGERSGCSWTAMPLSETSSAPTSSAVVAAATATRTATRRALVAETRILHLGIYK